MDTKAKAYTLISTDNTLLTLLGGLEHIEEIYPKSFESLPMLTYTESNKRVVSWFDNMPMQYESTMQFDIWSYTGTSEIEERLEALFAGELYTLDFSQDVPNTDDAIKHRVMRFRRAFVPDDLD
jgi:hypothetical protein